MTITNGYIARDDLARYLRISATTPDEEQRLDDAVNAASRSIDAHCGRIFYDTGTASARTYRPLSDRYVLVDDFHTTTGLTVATDEADDGSYSTTWSSTDYLAEPVSQIMLGVAWPYWRIAAVGTRTYPTTHWWPSVRVTARWGWSATPEPVRQATLMLAAELYRLADAPFGVAGFGDIAVVRLRGNPKVAELLRPYRRSGLLVA